MNYSNVPLCLLKAPYIFTTLWDYILNIWTRSVTHLVSFIVVDSKGTIERGSTWRLVLSGVAGPGQLESVELVRDGVAISGSSRG